MPVYIKELVVRARVESSGKAPPQPPGASAVEPINQKAVVEDCVDEVLRILERKQER